MKQRTKGHLYEWPLVLLAPDRCRFEYYFRRIDAWVYVLENSAGRFVTRESLADTGRTIAENYRLNLAAGESFLSELVIA